MRRARQPKQYYQCVECGVLVPKTYLVCTCGHDHSRQIIVCETREDLEREYREAMQALHVHTVGTR